MNKGNLFKYLQIAIAIGFIIGICFSFELWFPINRTFPRVPFVFESSIFLDQILTIILIISLVGIIFLQNRKVILSVAIVSLFLLIFFDQMRLQPWVYQYFLLLSVFALTKKEGTCEQTLRLVQIIIVGTYFWSGVQKLNYTFAYETLPILLEPLEHFVFVNDFPLGVIGLSLALIEILIGCGLLFKKTRKFSVCLAVTLHTVILILLIAKNYNSIVWIWNATLIALVIFTFWHSDNSISEMFSKASFQKYKFATVIILASVLLPIMSFVGLWDMYLSGALYSGNTEVGVIRTNKNLIKKLSPKAKMSIIEVKGNKMLPLLEWSINELNVPVYPEKRVFKGIANKVCKMAEDKNNLTLIIKERPAIIDGTYNILQIKCNQL